MHDETQPNSANGAAGSNPIPEYPESIGEDQKAADETRQRIRRLPPEVGAVLVTVGVIGVLLPGPVGMPLLLAGGLALMPSVFGRAERWVERRFPTLHWHGMKNVNRFIDDFEKRYPPDDDEFTD